MGDISGKISGPMSCYLLKLDNRKKICMFGDVHNNLYYMCNVSLGNQLDYIFNNLRDYEFRLLLEYGVVHYAMNKQNWSHDLNDYALGKTIRHYIGCFNNNHNNCPKNVEIINIDTRYYDIENLFNMSVYVNIRKRYPQYDTLIYDRLIIFNQYISGKITTIDFIERFFETAYPDSSLELTLIEMEKLLMNNPDKYDNVINFIAESMENEIHALNEQNKKFASTLVTEALKLFFYDDIQGIEEILKKYWVHFVGFVAKFMDLYTLCLLENDSKNTILFVGNAHVTLYLNYFKMFYNVDIIAIKPQQYPGKGVFNRCIDITADDIIRFFKS